MIVDQWASNAKATFVEAHASSQQLFNHVIWNSPSTNVLDNNLHLRIVREAAILLLESKMRQMKMHDEGWRIFGVFFEDIWCGFN